MQIAGNQEAPGKSSSSPWSFLRACCTARYKGSRESAKASMKCLKNSSATMFGTGSRITITAGMFNFSKAIANPNPSQELKIAKRKPLSIAAFRASSSCSIVRLLFVLFSLM